MTLRDRINFSRNGQNDSGHTTHGPRFVCFGLLHPFKGHRRHLLPGGQGKRALDELSAASETLAAACSTILVVKERFLSPRRWLIDISNR
jgi:hypothetical protein